MKFQHVVDSLILALLILGVYIFTISPLTRAYAPYGLILCFFFFGMLSILGTGKQSYLWRVQNGIYRVLFFTFVMAILLWIGTTGWFFSPFFYVLYMLALCLALLFSPSVSFAFVLVLVAVLLPQIRLLDMGVEALNILVLFLMIPLSYWLRRFYLESAQKEKKILILETERRNFRSSVEQVLDNKICRFFAEVRQPINDIRLMASFMPRLNSEDDIEASRKRIVAASEEALQMLRCFEEENTGMKLLSSPRVEVKSGFDFVQD